MKNMLDKVLVTINRYYAAIGLFMAATVMLMLAIHNSYYGVFISIATVKIILSLIYGAILAIVIRHIIDLLDKEKKKDLLYLLIPVMMLIVYFNVLGDLGGFASSLKYFFLCVLTAMTLFAIPFMGKKGDSAHYSYKALIALALTMLCYMILISGVFFIVGSISTLFVVEVLDYIYVEIALFILGVLMPTLFLSLVPSHDAKEQGYPDFINRVVLFIIYPILLVYTLVLYTYFIKILVEFKWPTNMLGNLTIYYLLISITVLYFTNKMKGLNKIVEMYPYALIIPNLMMLMTFILRIKAYGFTELRYYGVLCFIFVMISIYIIKKVKKVKYIPITLAVLLLISIFGPLSAFNVSKISQQSRLENILISNNMLKDNVITRNPNLSEEDQQTIIDILVYFSNVHSLKDLKFIPEGFNFSMLDEVFGFPNERY